ncbi:Trk system potassium uptake protein TrkA [Paramagnetospirillum magnetotacticum MS-1]|uniref:Trk system potassium uptake protein TrkA n=1 Tax=Paramagnetospirillum magnetotacticum MS-1 TaxID=272627 RepID=A0A0C2YUL2_PARME|nr:Trk system potassium transporter TrkA [Paramagnetospirillum magnetotacticum]KIL98813.1 Trk system potassium uptake protein TrkA [Paramagnetospirillum magnetotacticum MS-1]
MKVIVCGAGQVGFNIAHYLAGENNDVTIIDQRPELIRKVSDTLDVQVVLGFASHPAVLEQAGAGDADMIIAVTAADEVNMVACQVAHSLFNVPTKIARVRSQAYLAPIWANLFSREHLPIDVIISPEIEVARAIAKRLQVPGAIDVIPLVGDKVRLIGVRCTGQCPLINTPLRQLTVLFPDLAIVIIGIVRDGKAIVPTSEDQMQEGDEVYFVVDTEHVDRALTAFGREDQEARRIVIFGGGNIGLFLAQQLEEARPGTSIKVIESNKERAEFVAKAVGHTVVIHGDALDPEILEEASVGAAEAVVAVTNDDETNILSGLLAKRYGCRRTMALINKTTYNSLVAPLGIDVAVNPRAITVSNILQHVRRGRIHAVHSLHEGFGELIEADALETSSLVGKPLREVKLPAGVLLGAVVHDGKVVSPRGSTVIHPGDRVILFATADAVKKVEKMFSVRLEYF